MLLPRSASSLLVELFPTSLSISRNLADQSTLGLSPTPCQGSHSAGAERQRWRWYSRYWVSEGMSASIDVDCVVEASRCIIHRALGCRTQQTSTFIPVSSIALFERAIPTMESTDLNLVNEQCHLKQMICPSSAMNLASS